MANGGFGSIGRVGVTENGRAIYQLTDAEGNVITVAKLLSEVIFLKNLIQILWKLHLRCKNLHKK